MSETSKTADNAIDVLFAMRDGEPAAPQHIARRLGINRTVAFRLLTTLHARGYVTREGGEYTLSRRIAQLADQVQPRLRRVVEPIVAELSRQLEETVVFQILDGQEAVVLAESFSPRSTALQARHEVGSRNAATANANGLALLAALPAKRRRAFLSEDPGGDLQKRLAETVKAGYASTTGALQEGVGGLAVGVRLPDDSAGSLGVLVPIPRAEQLEAFFPEIQRAARLIEARCSG